MLRYLYFLGILPFLVVSVVESRSTYLPLEPFKLKTTDWDKNKLEVLTNFVENILKNTGNGVTIVASQNVYNSDGSFKEIRTIELNIPNNMFNREHWIRDEEDMGKIRHEDDDFSDNIEKLQQDFKKAYYNKGIREEAGYQKFSQDGNVEFELYVNKDDVFYQDEEGMGYQLKDHIRGTSKQTVEDEFKRRLQDRDNNTLISVLMWDTDGKFDSKEAKVEPKLLAYVDKASDSATEEMMDSATEAISNIVLNNPDRVAKELSGAMASKYPEYNWFVTKWLEENADNAKHDVYMKIIYYNVRVGEDNFEYTVYGMKK